MADERIVEPRLLRGFRDYLPAQMNARLKLIATIRQVYERYGFLPLETPAQEYRVTLMGYGDENTKQIFGFTNPEEEEVALRFDLTVPLARVVAQYPDLPLPFRRYQVAPVWRADKPDPGRFREFIQFDLDSVGSSSLAADAEILCAIYDTLTALVEDRFIVRFSDRKVLNSLLDFAGIPRAMAHGVFRVLDKLEKVGIDNIAAELMQGRVDVSGDKIPGLGLQSAGVDRIREFLAIPRGTRAATLEALARLFKDVPSAEEAVQELRFICTSLDGLGIPETNVTLDLSIARGLDYYTGPVFEAQLLDAPEIGSVVGGGRYDGLVERFLGRKIPAVGASIGVDRLFAALQKLGRLPMQSATAQVLVTIMEPERLADYQRLTRQLRQSGINTEMYLGEEKSPGKQLQYANRQGIPVAILMGSNEFEKGEVTVKDLILGGQLQEKKKSVAGKDREAYLAETRTVQVTVPKDACAQTVLDVLARHSIQPGR
jgi:histidyl-tRNA synthetase